MYLYITYSGQTNVSMDPLPCTRPISMDPLPKGVR